MLNYSGQKRIALSLGFAGANQVVLLRDAFGRERARGVPVKGYLAIGHRAPGYFQSLRFKPVSGRGGVCTL